MNLTQIEKLISMAYKDMADEDNFDYDFVMGCLAEAQAIVQGDTGSFDNQEGV